RGRGDRASARGAGGRRGRRRRAAARPAAAVAAAVAVGRRRRRRRARRGAGGEPVAARRHLLGDGRLPPILAGGERLFLDEVRLLAQVGDLARLLARLDLHREAQLLARRWAVKAHLVRARRERNFRERR